MEENEKEVINEIEIEEKEVVNENEPKVKVKTEQEIKREILKNLGIKSDSEFDKMRKAYEQTLTERERTANELEKLKELNMEYKRKNDEQNDLITIFKLKNNNDLDEMETTLKMARGLINEDTDIEAALKIVLDKTAKPNLKGKPLEQQTNRTGELVNPFDPKTYNAKECNELFKSDPEKAKRLAKKAGINLT